MTSSNRRNKAQFDLDDDHDDDSEVEQLKQRLPRIIVDEAVSPSNRSSRRGSRDEEERHVGFAADPETGRDNGGWTSRHHEGEQELGQSRNSKEKHTYPPSSTTEEPSPTSSNSGTGDSGKNTSSKKSWSKKLRGHSPSIPESLAWVPSKLNWKGLRRVLRSMIASWCGLVLILAHPSQVAMGRAGFLAAKVSIVVVSVVLGYNLLLKPNAVRVEEREYGSPKLRSTMSELKIKVPGPEALLTKEAPARSYHEALRPDLRYLTLDSWSGMTGQHLTALSLLYLAQLTQRVAIIPSWRDADHYGDAMIRMSDLFDLEKYRNQTGTLFVEWDDVKPLDRAHEKTDTDEIGCVMGNNPFEGGRSFWEHNLAQTVWRVPRSGGSLEHSIESFVLFDFDQQDRYQRIKQFAKENNHTLSSIPKNMLEDQLLCYSNLWDLNHASAHAGGVRWYDGFKGQQKEKGELKEMLPISQRGTHPEWWAVGQYIDFSPDVWKIALNATLHTLKTKTIPKNLVTVHLRRGDFKEWCSTGHNCTPAIDRYVEKVEPMLASSPPGTKVLVTTDEQDDEIFLSSIDALGWYRIDHRKLGTFSILESKYRDAARWYDAAIDQAILSLGSSFVGTSGSQVSLVTELRVAAWNGGETDLVERPA